MVHKIEIKGYKSIKEASVELGHINLLIGGNGIGKSNFVSTFSLINHIYEQRLQSFVMERGGADALLYMGQKETDKIELDIYFSDRDREPHNRFIAKLRNAENSLYIDSISTAFFSTNQWHERIYQDVPSTESNFKNIYFWQTYLVKRLIESIKIYHFHDTGDKSPMKRKSKVEDNRSLRANGDNIAAFLYYIQEKHPEHFYRIEHMVRSVSPFFEGFSLMPSQLNEEDIELRWKQKGAKDQYFNAYQLSDGTLRFICLVTLLLQPNLPEIIIIDEPELGLHPFAISKLAALIQQISEETQVIVTTQSVELINHFEPKDLIVVDVEDGATSFKRLNNEELVDWLEEYTLGEIWCKNILGGQPF